jgi:hypothetical protein
MEMNHAFQKDQRVKQRSTGKVGIVKSYDEDPTTGTGFYHVQFDGESQFTRVLENDLQTA